MSLRLKKPRYQIATLQCTHYLYTLALNFLHFPILFDSFGRWQSMFFLFSSLQFVIQQIMCDLVASITLEKGFFRLIWPLEESYITVTPEKRTHIYHATCKLCIFSFQRLRLEVMTVVYKILSGRFPFSYQYLNVKRLVNHIPNPDPNSNSNLSSNVSIRFLTLSAGSQGKCPRKNVQGRNLDETRRV